MPDLADKQPSSPGSDTRLEFAPRINVQEAASGPEQPWYRVPHLLRLNLLLMVPLLTSYLVGFDGSMLNGVQTVPAWQNDFDHPSGGMLGLVTTAQTIGSAGALPIGPYLTDRFGRRPPIAIGSLLVILAAGLQGGAQNLGMFIGSRVIIGIGSSFVATAAAPLVAELAYPSHRGIITAIYNTSWYLGSIVAAWTTYGTFRIPNSWSWRIPSLLQALPSLIQLALIYLVPESPRWLMANNRPEEARRVLCRYHGGSEHPNELVRAELEEIAEALEAERSQQSASYMHFIRTPANRHRLLICFSLGFIIQWCGNGLVSYYLVPVLNNIGITDPEMQNVINGVLQIFNYITAVGAAFFVDRVGRRTLFLVSTAGVTLAFVIWTAVSAVNEQQHLENKGLGIGVVIMIFVFFFFYNIAMNPVPMAYLLEILPFTLRAKGLTIFNFAQYGSSIFNGFANPVALEAIGWKYYIVFTVLAAVWFIFIWFVFPETKGMSLEEVAVVFDGRPNEEVEGKLEAA
ncbi:general substrate transporter [Aspergillus pseudodeflectus]|uniref:General substrate transporter n=1 Tax=Aspergillus pseudodeflectus TaxID=176178 RepID=A0ABR4KBI0_9EURO